MSFNTEGKISTYTNSVCYNDLIFSHENFFKDKRILYFGGFGGEYIRHPLFSNIWNSSNIGSKTCPTLREISQLCGIEYNQVKDLIKDTFYECKSSESFCKMFYDEYYRRYVRGAGEERIRMFYFSVQPMMSKPFILAIRNRVPLKWVGYSFYVSFLNEINPALTSIGVHGGVPNIKSSISLFKSDFKNKSYLYNLYRKFVFKSHIRVRPGSMNIEKLLNQLDTNTVKVLFDRKYLEERFSSFSKHTQCKIAALLYYVDGLSKV